MKSTNSDGNFISEQDGDSSNVQQNNFMEVVIESRNVAGCPFPLCRRQEGVMRIPFDAIDHFTDQVIVQVDRLLDEPWITLLSPSERAFKSAGRAEAIASVESGPGCGR